MCVLLLLLLLICVVVVVVVVVCVCVTSIPLFLLKFSVTVFDWFGVVVVFNKKIFFLIIDAYLAIR